MRGSKAKILRKISGVNGSEREYQKVKSPTQWRHPVPMTVIADESRYLYQTLKGRRGLPGI